MNITLIGMPGCGKSTVGIALARATGMKFVDVDDVIIARTGKKLAQIIEERGDEGFRLLEGEINASLDLTSSVIAPGGSVVYEENAMEHLKSISHIVYLELSCKALQRRLGDLHARGVSILPGQTFEELYEERCVLYHRYADVTIHADGLNVAAVTARIRRELKI